MEPNEVQNADVLVFSVKPGTRKELAAILEKERIAGAFFGSLADLTNALDRDTEKVVLFDVTEGNPPESTLRDLIRKYSTCAFVVLLGEDESALAAQFVEMGAYDFITTPLHGEKVPTRVKVSLSRHDKAMRDLIYQRALEGRLSQRTEEAWVTREKVRQQFVNIIRTLEKALQAKNVYTEGHSRRVAEKSIEVAREMGIQGEDLRNIELAALFHDIGKIGIRDDVLNKGDRLSDNEYEHVKMHPLIGEQILSQVEGFAPVVPLVRHEHERWDGDGYPDGISGEDIPLGARIIAIADAWDSMVYDRIYRPSLNVEECLQEIERCSGTQFDPSCVKIFVEVERRKLKEGKAKAKPGK